ncbi:hypothetical protein ACIQRW_08805 [Streptomyces sp. NPDC091287]|uniref:hypothetical protein n=1 Tax=Streptomyces sp. NPDC091287 TaxID=3365988 RepID=UPI00380F3323
MAAEITSVVHLDVEVGDEQICADIGTFTVPVVNDTVDEASVRTELGGLLKKAGEYLLETGQMPYLTPLK